MFSQLTSVSGRRSSMTGRAVVTGTYLVRQLFIDIKKACNSVRREFLSNILMTIFMPVILVSLTKICV
jgi:hypothetical protein